MCKWLIDISNLGYNVAGMIFQTMQNFASKNSATKWSIGLHWMNPGLLVLVGMLSGCCHLGDVRGGSNSIVQVEIQPLNLTWLLTISFLLMQQQLICTGANIRFIWFYLQLHLVSYIYNLRWKFCLLYTCMTPISVYRWGICIECCDFMISAFQHFCIEFTYCPCLGNLIL